MTHLFANIARTLLLMSLGTYAIADESHAHNTKNKNDSVSIVTAQSNDIEPSFPVIGNENLIIPNSLSNWHVPSDRWTIKDDVIIGDTGGEKLDTPEWIYTKKEYSDFLFTAEVKLTGAARANSGIYFRVKRFNFLRGEAAFEAPSGYEFDVARNNKHNASLGDWYARPSFRIFADQSALATIYNDMDWNRMTIRAKGNHIEFWLNGIKVIDYVDNDPKSNNSGLIGFQMHDKLQMKVQLRNISVVAL